MSPARWLGVSILVVGALLVLNFLATPINPSVTLGDLGVLALLLGSLVVASDGFGMRRAADLNRSSSFSKTFGWQLFSAGLLVALGAFLLENQVSCSCPANGRCDCGAILYSVALAGGALAAFIGAVIIAMGRARPSELARTGSV